MKRKLLSVVDLVIIDTNPTTFSHKVCELSLGSAHNFPSSYRNLPGIDFGDSDMRRKLFSVVDLLYIHSNLPDSRAPDPSSIWAPPSSAPNIDFRESNVRTKLKSVLEEPGIHSSLTAPPRVNRVIRAIENDEIEKSIIG